MKPLRARDVMLELGCSRAHAYRLMREMKAIVSRRSPTGRTTLIRVSRRAFRAWLEAHEESPWKDRERSTDETADGGESSQKNEDEPADDRSSSPRLRQNLRLLQGGSKRRTDSARPTFPRTRPASVKRLMRTLPSNDAPTSQKRRER
jgi:predicted DNA-binding transcriptional regulator AlpA